MDAKVGVHQILHLQPPVELELKLQRKTATAVVLYHFWKVNMCRAPKFS